MPAQGRGRTMFLKNTQAKVPKNFGRNTSYFSVLSKALEFYRREISVEKSWVPRTRFNHRSVRKDKGGNDRNKRERKISLCARAVPARVPVSLSCLPAYLRMPLLRCVRRFCAVLCPIKTVIFHRLWYNLPFPNLTWRVSLVFPVRK